MDARPLNRLEVLKGIAIVIFMFYHFRVLAMGDPAEGGSYGRAAVGLFFLISGFGLNHSLARRLGTGQPLVSALLIFWRDRAVRVYPQYWMAAALTFLVYGLAYAWWQWLGVDSPYWFISQVLQCYLAAPLLYAVSRSGRTAVRWLPLAVFAGVNAWAYGLHGEVSAQGVPGQLAYQRMLLTHVVLFYLGMLWAQREAGPKRGGAMTGLLLAAGFAALMVACTRPAGAALSVVSALGFLAASFVMFAGFLRLDGLFPGCRLLAFLGTYSLSIYLFEPFYYFALYRLRLLEVHSWTNVPWFLGALPLFVGVCVVIQKAQDAALRKAWPRS